MTDFEMHDAFTGDNQVGIRLEAYALARLSPSAASVRRMRARVMREARSRLEAVAVQPATVARPLPRRTALRRVAGLLLAASLSLVVVAGGVLAAGPGGPLYAAAMWLEELTLPAAAGPRTEAEIERLEKRLLEARFAAARGDGGALSAAIAEYGATIDEAVTATGADADLQARLEAVLAKHLSVLASLTSQVPPQARDAIERAMDRSSKARDRIGGPQGFGNGGHPNGNGSGSGGNGIGNGNDNGNGNAGNGNGNSGGGSGSNSGNGDTGVPDPTPAAPRGTDGGTTQGGASGTDPVTPKSERSPPTEQRAPNQNAAGGSQP